MHAVCEMRRGRNSATEPGILRSGSWLGPLARRAGNLRKQLGGSSWAVLGADPGPEFGGPVPHVLVGDSLVDGCC